MISVQRMWVLKRRRSHKALLPAPRTARTRCRTRMTHDALVHSLSLRMGGVLGIHGHAHLHLHLHHGCHLAQLPLSVKGILVGHGERILLSWMWRCALLLSLRSRAFRRGYATWLDLYLLHRLQLVECKVLEERRPGGMSGENAQHLLSGIREQLLCIARVCDWLPFLGVVQPDMTQICVRDVANEYPSHFEYTLPFVRCPYGAASGVVNRRQHFSHATKVSARIDTEEQVNRTSTSTVLERLVEPLVARIGGAPYLVLQGFMDVIFGV